MTAAEDRALAARLHDLLHEIPTTTIEGGDINRKDPR